MGGSPIQERSGHPGYPGHPQIVANGWNGLENLAAGSGAGRDVLGLGEALALAGILALAGGCRAAFAGALALAGVGATALDAVGVGGRGEGACGEDRSGSRDHLTLVHEDPPECASLLCSHQVIRNGWPRRYATK